MSSATIATSRLSSKGQVTIPAEIRRRLGLSSGDSVVFRMEDDGTASIVSDDRYARGMRALARVQEAFEGAAEEAGLETEQDVVDMIKRFRRGEAI